MLCKRFYRTHQCRNFQFITTPIFYVNAAPHIGHLYSAVIADAIYRFNKLIAPINGIFSTGTDEHGIKIQQAANKNGVPVNNYCDSISSLYANTFKNFNIDYTRFIRTTDNDHQKAVQEFWNILKSGDNIYSTKYSGWYCVPDETFLTECQLKEAPNGQKISAESEHPVEWTEEINYMFKLGKYQDDIIKWINSDVKIHPKKFSKILMDFLQEPLPDISISRPLTRMSWGIPVPNNTTQVIYVWLDALVNYLTCAGFPNESFKQKWPPTVQIIGKDILKFHGVYWPAFLIAAGLELPRKIFVHSHWTVDGQKMSKSKMNVVDPNERAKIYTFEGIRYFLLREGVAHSDGNYSDVKIFRVLNSELADTLGNLLSRCCAKSLNPKHIYPKVHEESLTKLLKLDATKRLIELLNNLPEKAFVNYKDFNFYLVVDSVIQTLHAANSFFETTKPWELKNKSGQDQEILETIISITMETLRQCSIILQPIVPVISTKLLDKLSSPHDERMWNNLKINWNKQEKDLAMQIEPLLFKRMVLPKERLEVQGTTLREKRKKKIK